MSTDIGTVPTRYHRAFNDRDFEAFRQVFDEDVEVVVDGMAFRGIDAAVGYGVMSVSRLPGLRVASERVVARSDDTVVTEVALVNGDPAGGPSRREGTACEVWRVRNGRALSVHSYYMPEPGDPTEAVRVPSRAEAAVVAEERAALQRVATLVARGVSRDQLFAAVTQEIGWLLAADATALVRFEPGDAVTLVAAWTSGPIDLPIGTSRPVDDLLRSMRETGRPWRGGTADLPLTAPFADAARALGLRTFVGVPIAVDGRTWGLAFAASSADRPFADGAEARLAMFTELVAVAIAGAQARAELRAFADEQAALRRVATLVVRAAEPHEVFTAVAAEVGQLLAPDHAVLARYDGEAITVVGTWLRTGEPPPTPVGGRLPLGGRNVSTMVFRTGRPARIEAGISGPIGEAASRDWKVRSSVGVPIHVEGQVWGTMVVAFSRPEPPPADVEARLVGFTELVGSAVSNAAARTELRGFADEQAALRRVATLVARAAAPEEVFAAVAAEVGRVLPTDFTFLSRYDPGPVATLVGTWARHDPVGALPVGTRVPLGGRNVVSLVFRTRGPARVDRYAEAQGPAAAAARAAGMRAAVGVPISVDGRLWGVVGAGVEREQALPADAEARLTVFTELVATAIANAQAQVQLRGYAREEAALRRVATRVARAAAPEEVFAAVAAELGRLLGCDLTLMNRYDAGDAATIVGVWSRTDVPAPVPLGHRAPLGGRNVTTRVFGTGRPARIDDYGTDPGAGFAPYMAAGFRSAAGAPISVGGRLWGVMLAMAREQPLPADTEARLSRFTELVATAISNAEAQAALAASRARIVAAADAARQRIERDLHDGVQQRLVSLALHLRGRARAAAPPGAQELTTHLDEMAAEVGGVLDELRELARGVHPVALAEGGLRPALKTLARRSAVPVRLDVRVDGRLPEPVELAAYYVVAEALTNAAKHADASVVDVQLATGEGVLHVLVRDDGRGGAGLTRGSGLAGLQDRVEALGGRISLESPPGSGTTLRVSLPLAAP